jgi:Gpi18-like mannosyltransferase
MARPSATGSPAASEASAPGLVRPGGDTRGPRHPINRLWFPGVFVAGVAIRVALLPTEGFRDDVDQFVGWVHHIAANGLGTLYGETAAGPVTFGPVMAYVWAILAAVEPGFRVATDASDAGIRALMKLPATAADIGLAIMVWRALRDRPRWALVGAAAILLHPAVIDISAWWGQYESLYLLSALAATILAIRGRSGWAAVAIAVSLMTKPQALPLLLPFVAWFWAHGGLRSIVRNGAVGATTVAVLWLPFIAEGGPLDYLRNLATYQNDIFSILSLRAWNLWWLVQEGAANGGFINDDVTILGPLTLRLVGYGLAGLLELAIAAAILRRPTARTLILGLIASVLVFFSFATQMHERYAFGALVFLALLVEEPAARWLSVAFGIVFTLNLLAAIPPTPEIGKVLPVAGPLGIAGSIAMLAITVVVVRMLVAGLPGPDAAPSPRGP